MHFGAGIRGGKRKPGRRLSFATKIQFNGNLMVGKTYTAQLGLKPGDEFESKLAWQQIRPSPLGLSRRSERAVDLSRLPSDGR
jgi:hypothetical protein